MLLPSSREVGGSDVRSGEEGHTDLLPLALISCAIDHPATFNQRPSAVFRYCWPLPTPSEQPFSSKQAWQIFPHLPRTLASNIVLPKSPSQASHLPTIPAQYLDAVAMFDPPIVFFLGGHHPIFCKIIINHSTTLHHVRCLVDHLNQVCDLSMVEWVGVKLE